MLVLPLDLAGDVLNTPITPVPYVCTKCANLPRAFALEDRIAEIAATLQRDPLPPNPPSGRQTHAKGSWTFEALCAAIEEIARDRTIPTHKALQTAGYGHACSLLKQKSMRERVKTALGLSDLNRKDAVWTRERVVAELA